MLDYRSLARRGLGPGRRVSFDSSFLKDVQPDDPAPVDDAPSSRDTNLSDGEMPAPPPVEAVGGAAPGGADTTSDLMALSGRLEPVSVRAADADAGAQAQRKPATGGIPACPVCGRQRSGARISSVGGRLMSRCWHCDLLTIVNPFDRQDAEAHAEHLHYSMRSFWFHLRGQLGELGHRGPIGYSGPAEYLDAIARAARDLAFVVPFEDLDRYAGQCPAILLFHALECVPDPKAFLRKCHRALAADGRLFVAASDAKSLHCLLRPAKWKGLRLKDQIFCYGPRTLSRLFRATGFRVARRVSSGLEVVGSGLDDAVAAADKVSGFAGFLKKWFRVIAWLANDFSSFGSVIYLEAVPDGNPRRKLRERKASSPAGLSIGRAERNLVAGGEVSRHRGPIRS